ncbi:hypothetical protein JW916_10100 [Candidatus Sumerlaeota bacterium]|nr:hypothetical protein [Candidatus Sumerlaeota bacterium]
MLQDLRWKIRNLLRAIFLLDPEFLCDTCRYNYGNACTRPERPNAECCPDYRRSGE